MQFGAPTTVAQAIAPFEKVKANLKAVLTAQSKKIKTATGQIDAALAAEEAAKKNTANVRKTQGAVIQAATEEELRAKALIEKLDMLLSTDKPVDLDTMKPAEKANAGHAQGD